MLPKFSVRKPLTVFVAVVLVIVLGIVSYLNMTPSLFPNLEFPYIIIITTYIGASPEEVETTVTRPLEQSMATLDNVEEVSSSSSENYSMVMIEFSDEANMDSVTVDINSKLTQLSGSWGEKVGTPYTMKINPNMLPVAIVAISKENSTIYELSDFTKDTLENKLEGIDGVASISVGGIVEQSLEVVLSEQRGNRKRQGSNNRTAGGVVFTACDCRSRNFFQGARVTHNKAHSCEYNIRTHRPKATA